MNKFYLPGEKKTVHLVRCSRYKEVQPDSTWWNKHRRSKSKSSIEFHRLAILIISKTFQANLRWHSILLDELQHSLIYCTKRITLKESMDYLYSWANSLTVESPLKMKIRKFLSFPFQILIKCSIKDWINFNLNYPFVIEVAKILRRALSSHEDIEQSLVSWVSPDEESNLGQTLRTRKHSISFEFYSNYRREFSTMELEDDSNEWNIRWRSCERCSLLSESLCSLAYPSEQHWR